MFVPAMNSNGLWHQCIHCKDGLNCRFPTGQKWQKLIADSLNFSQLSPFPKILKVNHKVTFYQFLPANKLLFSSLPCLFCFHLETSSEDCHRFCVDWTCRPCTSWGSLQHRSGPRDAGLPWDGRLTSREYPGVTEGRTCRCLIITFESHMTNVIDCWFNQKQSTPNVPPLATLGIIIKKKRL